MSAGEAEEQGEEARHQEASKDVSPTALDTFVTFDYCRMLDAARGMAYLESNNIIHRDLAARNLLVDANTQVKVVSTSIATANNI